MVVRRLREMGFVIKYVPDSTFYLCDSFSCLVSSKQTANKI